MRRLAYRTLLTACAGAILALTAVGLASANGFSTDSWGCPWSGSTSFPGMFNGYAVTDGAVDCAPSMGVQLDWQDVNDGTWHVESWNWEYDEASITVYEAEALEGSHQVYVTGHGYGQIEYTHEP